MSPAVVHVEGATIANDVAETNGCYVTSIKLVVPLAFLVFGGVLMVWLMSGAQAAQVQQEPQAAPEAKVTQLMSKNLPDFPGKEGVMITVEYRRAVRTQSTGTTPMSLCMCWRARS